MRSSAPCFVSPHAPLIHPSIPLARPDRFFDQRRGIRVGGKTKTITEERQETYTDQQQALQQRQAYELQQQQQQQQNLAQDYTNAPKASSVLEQDVGVRNFLGRIARTTGSGLTVAGGTATLVLAGILPIPSMFGAVAAALVGFGCYMGAMAVAPTQFLNNKGHMETTSPVHRHLLANIFFAAYGYAMTPLLCLAPPTLVLAAGMGTVAAVGGMAAYALTKPSGSLLKWGGPLFAGIMGLLVCSIFTMFFGGGGGAFWLLSLGGVAIFSAFVGYDMHVAMEEYKQGRADHLAHSMNMFINIINIFQDILRILLMFSGRD
eukprot:TRINITY_DN6903_c0_g1_i1.p2 TRINITY_DN6903_c0_g1~~TRINITY_DN6903_c0_g1_i1.p2  ORF type:complete len:340 (-),score=57.49 TRINITY_DN6903_c0_g1_i1:1377-2333(-)